ERRFELGRDQGVPPGGGPDLLLDGVRSLFHGRLTRARARPDFAVAQRVHDFLLAPRQRGGFREGAIQRIQRLLPPRGCQRIAPLAQRIRQWRQRVGAFLARGPGPARIALARGVGRFLHRLLRTARGRLRALERQRLAGALHAAGQRVGRRREVALG